MVAARNALVRPYIRQAYQLAELMALWDLLSKCGTLTFSPLASGLFSAAAVSEDTAYTGYAAVWVRDNVYVAYAHYLDGSVAEKAVAVAVAKQLAQFFWQERLAFERTASAQRAPKSQMDRPHVRFEGRSLEKLEQPWNHAQNDALGYFLWFFCELLLEGALALTAENHSLLALFPPYLEAIQYWQDEDSGHWEEPPKIEASSIGAVVAGLQKLQKVLALDNPLNQQKELISGALLEDLIDRGQRAISKILPSESIQLGKERRYDAALLFLAYPLQVMPAAQSFRVVADTTKHLQGNDGISRYQGDSFWCRDYQDIPESIRTDVSEKREVWLQMHNRQLRPNEEAQWCIFDSIISEFYGWQYQQTRQEVYLEKQTAYFNRAIAQLTSKTCPHGSLRCPELYYLQSGKWIANDATPLLWAQANLLLALKWMKRSLL